MKWQRYKRGRIRCARIVNGPRRERFPSSVFGFGRRVNVTGLPNQKTYFYEFCEEGNATAKLRGRKRSSKSKPFTIAPGENKLPLHWSSIKRVDEKALPVDKICTIVMNNTVKSKLEKKQKGVNSVQKLTTLSTAEEKTKTCKS